MQFKSLFKWKSKVQIKKGVPFIYFLKHFKQYSALSKGNEIESELALIDNKLCIVIRLE